jgi:hypothetical protein
MLSSATARAQPSSYAFTSNITGTNGFSGNAVSPAANGLRTDGSGTLYVLFQTNGGTDTSFLKINSAGTISSVATFSGGGGSTFNYLGGFAISSNGSIFFVGGNGNPYIVRRWSPGDDVNTYTQLFSVSTGGQTWSDLAVNPAGTIVYISAPTQVLAFSNWNGTTASSNAVGSTYSGSARGISVDSGGNVCVATSTGCYYTSVGGTTYSLTGVISQSNSTGYGGRAIAIDADGQALIVSGNSLYNTSVTGQFTQLVTSPLSTTVPGVYGIAVGPGRDVYVLTTVATSNYTIARYRPVY